MLHHLYNNKFPYSNVTSSPDRLEPPTLQTQLHQLNSTIQRASSKASIIHVIASGIANLCNTSNFNMNPNKEIIG